MDKKATFELSGEMLKSFFYVFMLLLVLVVLAILAGIYLQIRIDTSSLEHKIIVDKVLMEQGCLNFNKERWNVYSVDVNRLNQDSLNGCLFSQDVGLRLNLKYNEKSLQANYNDRMLGYLSFCENENNFRCSNGGLNVKVLDNENIYDGKLEYEVITKNG